jgi:beta-N-acetylhexosaminidase
MSGAIMKKLLLLAGIFLTVFSSLIIFAPLDQNGYAQVTPPDSTTSEQAQELFNQMTPEERVGQLFLVSFEGTNVDLNSKIYDLIMNYHIGGVILMAENNNFIGPQDTLDSAYTLINELQQIEWFSANPEGLDAVPQGFSESNFIPLFIAISQEGDGYPYDQILSGLTPLPDLMAIGATWSPELSQSVGEVMGSELNALGINMLLGPSLDVLNLDYSEGKEALGTRSFGADPYWVGKLGGAYIEGLHSGSDGKMLVISKHFPGRGSADRDPNIEMATVRKPYDLLLQNDLAPFFAVTGNAEDSQSITDGLLAAHVRYEGLQGAIRNTTRPISFDVTAIEQLFALPELNQWRQNGGILVSDNLGSEAVRRFYDPNNILFDARQIARNAINAGVDLLYMDNFVATGDSDQYTTIIRTLDFFIQKYMEDETFSQRVDASVLRLLEKKFSLYPEFSLDTILGSRESLAEIGQSSNISFEVAQKSVTLLHPHQNDYANAIPNSPGLSDRTVFFTELRLYRQCSSCADIEMIPSDALRKSVIRLYGPQAGGDVAQYLLSTFSFNDLLNVLNGSEEGQIVEEELRAANWVVFAFMDADPDRPASLALKRLLDERPELLANKNSVAFAFNHPLELDATEISKLTAYFAVFSKIPSFTEIAARVLFQEIIPSGNLPISLPAIGYDLNIATSPDPDQNIPLMLDVESADTTIEQFIKPTSINTAEPTQSPSFKTGDTLPLTTGVIYDHNHNPVPDGTVARFYFTMEGESNFIQTVESTTRNGIAKAEFLIQNEGRLLINVTSEDALNSDKLALIISEGQAAVITVIVPTATATLTPSPTPTIATPTPSATITPTLVPPLPKRTSGSDWILSMLFIWGISAVIFVLSRTQVNIRWSIRWALLSAIGGMVSYIFLSLDFGLNRHFLNAGAFKGITIALIIGIATGWMLGWLWYRQLNRRARAKSTNASSSGSG